MAMATAKKTRSEAFMLMMCDAQKVTDAVDPNHQCIYTY